MLKFDLTRKYLVGFLTLAMVFSLFALPVASQAVNAADVQSKTADTNVVQAPPAAPLQLPAGPRTWKYWGPVLTPSAGLGYPAPGWQDVRTSYGMGSQWLDYWFASDVTSVPTNPWWTYWSTTSPTGWTAVNSVFGPIPFASNGMANSFYAQGGDLYWKTYLSDGTDIYTTTTSWNTNVVINTPVMVLQHYESGGVTIDWTLGPEIYQKPTGQWQMWMTGVTDTPDLGQPSNGGPPAIYYAQSADGVIWDILPKNAQGVPQPVIAATAQQPSVLVENGTYFMWFDDAAGNIKFAQSLDGVSWTPPITEIATGTPTPTYQSPSIISDFLNFGYMLFVTESNTTQVSLFYLPYNILTGFQPPSPDTNYANVPGAAVSQIVTVTVKDQFGVPVSTGGINYTVGGYDSTALTHLPASPLTSNASGEAAVTLTFTPTPGTFTGISSLTTTVVFDLPGATGSPITFTKIWTYTPSFTGITVDNGIHYNYPGTTHTVTVFFWDQYGNPFNGAYGLYLNKVNAPTDICDYTTGTNTYAVLHDTSTIVGVHEHTITGFVAGVEVGINPLIPAGIKIWANHPAVDPDNAVNALGATHEFVIKGAPRETVEVSFSSAGIFDLQNLTLLDVDANGYNIHPSNALPMPVANINHIDITLDDTGTATIYVMSQAPGKFYMDTWFSAIADLNRDPVMIKRSKAYAELHQLVITPPSEINPITQVPTWDVHTVTVVVQGEFPVKPATQVPPGGIKPPEGGDYVIIGGNQLWAINVPIGDVTVDWDVNWNYTKNGLVDIWADRVGDIAYLPGNPDLNAGLRAEDEHQDGDPLTVEHDLYATSISDANGEASLTYHMEFDASANWGDPETRTCTYYWPCFVDNITAIAGYGDDHLDAQYGTITATADKEWRDHAFKLIKYNGHLPIGSNDYIPGAKFFLRRMDLVGDPIYVPPMPNTGGVIGWSDTYAPYTNPPGNAYIVEEIDSLNGDNNLGVVTTDVYGEALWMHLPYGVYGLYEFSVPAPFTLVEGLLFEFTIDADAPYWCGPDPKITVHYEANTPTSPYFYKITYCGTAMIGVTFEVTNLDTPEIIAYLTDANGRLQIDLTDFTPPYDTTFGTWYKVHEVSNAVLTSYGVYAVPDFYFYIQKTGVWYDDTFYDAIYGDEVWPLTTLPWAWDPTTPRHWVVDPKIGTEPVQPIEITLDLLEGWNLVGVPLVTNDTIAHLFGVEFNRAFAWDPTLPGPYGGVGSYWNCSNAAPVPGAGFWVKMDADDAVTMEGMAVGSPVALDLYEGWNIVVNPFETAIDWDTVTLGGEPIADTTAMAFSFDGTTYHMANFATDSMAVGQGFWLSLDADATIVFTK